jgi:Ran GTPase-activating protein (RanGAP) involved in mRNA processing and transport
MDSLKKICLENNLIKDKGAVSLSKVLEENDTLLSLYLENNLITEIGAKAIAKMLRNKVKLSKLNLNNNPIRDEGAQSIAEGIMYNETLRVITLADIGLTKISIPHIAKSLKNKRFLTKILLDSNKIGIEGAQLLAEGIKDNETLTNLHLSHC